MGNDWDGSDAQARAARTVAKRLDENGFRRLQLVEGGYFYAPVRDLMQSGHGFRAQGPRPYRETRADRRRSAYEDQARWVLEHRPDVLTPAQAEALYLFHEDSRDPADGPPIEYCVDDTGRSLPPRPQDNRPLRVWAVENGIDLSETLAKDVPPEVAAADDEWMDEVVHGTWHEAHGHIYPPLSIAKSARYLGVPVGAFRDRLKRAERRATEAWNYEALRRGGKPIPDMLTKYRRRRAKKGRAAEKE